MEGKVHVVNFIQCTSYLSLVIKNSCGFIVANGVQSATPHTGKVGVIWSEASIAQLGSNAIMVTSDL